MFLESLEIICDISINQTILNTLEDTMVQRAIIDAEHILPMCNWTQELAKEDAASYAKEKDVLFDVHPTWYYHRQAHREIARQHERVDGDKRLKRLHDTLNAFDEKGYRRSSGQKLFHKAFICASLKKIYGDDLDRNLVRLMKEYDLDELKNDVIVCTPRRFGKTTAVALFVAAYLISQPAAEISIYSTGRRASQLILLLIYRLVLTYYYQSGMDAGIQVFNQEQLRIRGCGIDPSSVRSYPSKVSIGEPLLF